MYIFQKGEKKKSIANDFILTLLYYLPSFNTVSVSQSSHFSFIQRIFISRNRKRIKNCKKLPAIHNSFLKMLIYILQKFKKIKRFTIIRKN